MNLRLILAAVLLLPSVALANPFQQKTMQDPFSARIVERSLVMPKGWIELSLGGEAKDSTSYWDENGEAVDFSGARFLYTTERLSFRWGLFPNAEAFLTLKGHYVALTNSEHGTDRAGIYRGDPTIGTRIKLVESTAPLTSVAAVIELKSPGGNESPGSYIGGPTTFQSFVTTTGGHDLRLGVDGKKQLAMRNVAVQGGVGWLHRFSGLVQYSIETDQRQMMGRVKVGERVYAGGAALVQGGPVALWAGPRFEMHGPVKQGTTSAWPNPNQNLDPVVGSDGWSLDADAGVIVQFSRHVQLAGGMSYPVRGEDLMYFPIEDIHPTRGITWNGALQFNY